MTKILRIETVFSGKLNGPPNPGLTVTSARRAEYGSAISRHDLPELWPLVLPEREGAGNAGCALHPRSRVQWVEGNAHEHTGSAEAIRHSLRNGFTAYFGPFPATNSSCHRRQRIEICL